MVPIDAGALTATMKNVYYSWSKRPDLSAEGPFDVKLVSRDFSGEYVLLVETGSSQQDRRVSLATDEDYGYPCFYVKAK